MSNREPAPPALRLVQAFVNTIDIETGADDLASPDRARQWLEGHDLIRSEDPVTPADLHRLVEVREAVRELLAANHDRSPVDAGTLTVLNRAAGSARLRLRFGPDRVAELLPDASGVDRALAVLLADIHRSTIEGTWDRLKVCLNDECRWAFYDRSKNHSGKWCVMRVCGNRMKARAYRARHAG